MTIDKYYYNYDLPRGHVQLKLVGNQPKHDTMT